MDNPGLIFDLDGTLIDSAPDIHASVNLVMAEVDLPPFTAAQVRGFIGGGVEILLLRCLTARNLSHDADLHRRMTARFLEVYETAHALTTLYPNVAEVLATLPNRLAICTNKPNAPTRSVLRHFDLMDLFPVIIGGNTLAQKKPDPAPLLEAIRQMGGAPALFIGDSEVDSATAHAARVPFVLFTEGYRKTAAEDLGAVARFANWRELPGLLENLQRK